VEIFDPFDTIRSEFTLQFNAVSQRSKEPEDKNFNLDISLLSTHSPLPNSRQRVLACKDGEYGENSAIQQNITQFEVDPIRDLRRLPIAK
jgi:hypothetical protein